MSAHYEVRKLRGAPEFCEVCGATDRKFEWANISGEYLGPDDYRSLCISCHRSFDLRRGHDRRMDHEWTPMKDNQRCSVCRARSKAAEYLRIKADPEREARLREQNRAAVRRYRERKVAV